MNKEQYIMNKEQENIKKFCKYMKIKLIKYHEDGFIASSKYKIRAGMEYLPHNGNIIFPSLKTVGYKTIYRNYLCFKDGDIIDNGIYNYAETLIRHDQTTNNGIQY